MCLFQCVLYGCYYHSGRKCAHFGWYAAFDWLTLTCIFLYSRSVALFLKSLHENDAIVLLIIILLPFPFILKN